MARQRKTSETKTGVAGWNESVGASSRKPTNGSRHNKLVADRRRRIAMLVVLLLTCVACTVCFWPPQETINRGLWLREGVEVVVTATNEDGSKPSAEALSGAVSTIRGRLGAAGLSEYSVSQVGDDKIAIDLAKSDDAQAIAEIVGGSGGVQFVRSDEIGDADALLKLNAGGEIVPVEKGTFSSFMDGSSVSSANVGDAGNHNYAIEVTFNDEGSKTFAEVTKELAEDTGRIAIVVGDRIVSAPSVSEEISGGKVYISGAFSAAEAGALKAALESNTIDLHFSFAKGEDVGPLVTETGLWVLSIGSLALILVFAIAAFVRLGRLAILPAGGMVVFALWLLGLMALASRVNMFNLTIPGVGAGYCAAIGTALALWLVVAGFVARTSDGKSIRGAATTAPREALRPLAAPVGVIGTASIVFLFLPIPVLREFGLVMVFGIICGIVAVFWYGVTTLRLLVMGSIQNDPESWGIHVAGNQDLSKEDAS